MINRGKTVRIIIISRHEELFAVSRDTWTYLDFCPVVYSAVCSLGRDSLSSQSSLPQIVKLNEWLSGLTAPLRHTLYLLCLRYHVLISYQLLDTEQLCVSEPAGETADTELEVLTQREYISGDKPWMGQSPQSDACLLRLQYCGALASCPCLQNK